jgi:predicted transcriptional regulator
MVREARALHCQGVHHWRHHNRGVTLDVPARRRKVALPEVARVDSSAFGGDTRLGHDPGSMIATHRRVNRPTRASGAVDATPALPPHCLPAAASSGTTAGSRRSAACLRRHSGYTSGMKTAVSIPDEVFEEAEQLARRTGRSRSDVYCRALVEYVARHAPDRVTEAMDRALEGIDESSDPFVQAAASRVLARTEW